jgi:hypothetical protein
MTSPDEESTDAEDAGEIPPMDFSLFVLSLNASALMHLGEGPAAEGEPQPNLPMARHTIDMLTVLEQKTRGNLTGREEHLLHQVLFDLRMRYSARSG